MAVLIERRVSTAAKWSRRLALFAATLFLLSVLGHRYAVVDTISLFWLLGIVLTLALVSVLLAAFGFFQLWEFGDKGGRNSTKGLIVALLVLAPFGWAVFRFLSLPGLTDISTDLVDPPRFMQAGGVRGPQMNPLRPISSDHAGIQIAYYPEITGRRYQLGVDTSLEITAAVLEQLGWWPHGSVRPNVASSSTTLEVAAPSLIVGLVSDVAIRITDEGETTYIDVRSASRYGAHDLGDNAAKINRFFAAVDEEITARNVLFPVPAE